MTDRQIAGQNSLISASWAGRVFKAYTPTFSARVVDLIFIQFFDQKNELPTVL